MYTKEQKQLILEKYLQWVDDITEAIPEKSVFSPEEIVMKVLDIASALYAHPTDCQTQSSQFVYMPHTNWDQWFQEDAGKEFMKYTEAMQKIANECYNQMRPDNENEFQ